MSTGQDPIRAQLIEARRNQILDAAASVFAEKGFHRATTKEIAQRAGVSEGTIYNYFTNKADLLVGIMTRLAELENLDVELESALQGDAREPLVAMVRQRLGRIQQSQEMLQAVLSEMLVDPGLRERFYQQYALRITTLLERYVGARIELGHMRPVDVPLTVRLIQSMFVGLIIWRILGDEVIQSRWDDVPEALATLVLDGLNLGDGG